MMASANPPHIKPYTLIRELSDDLVARTNQEHGLLHFHDLDTGIRSADHKRSIHGEVSVSGEMRFSSQDQCKAPTI